MAATSHESDSHPAFLEKQCLGFLQALVTEKIGFKFHISSGDFACSLDFNGADPPTQTRSSTVKVKRKSPSTRKRNADRRRLFLENKKRTGPISVDTEQARSAAASFAKARESQLDKVLEAEVKEKEEVAGNKLVPETVDIATENPESPLDLNPRPIHFQQGNSGGSAESLDTSSDPSRDEIVEVTEFMQFKPHPRPLQRARARYEARTGNTPWEKRHIGADHHPSDLSQGSQVVQAQEGRSLHRLGAYRDEPSDQLSQMPWVIPDCPTSEVSYIGHGLLAHSEAHKRDQRKSSYKYGDYPVSSMNDQMCEDLVLLQTCLDRRVIGAKSQQLV